MVYTQGVRGSNPLAPTFLTSTLVGFFYVNKYKSQQDLILLLALDSNCSKEEIEYLAEQIESYFFFSNTIGIQAKRNESLFALWVKKLRGVKSVKEIKK